ncbi:MAG: hypothetical protein H6864_05800 [Micavibrio sp.]|nr:hypothetical protein [Micavibrio sp.]
MNKYLMLSVLILAGCATAASYNRGCFQEHQGFNAAVECTKQKMNNDPRVNLPTNQGFVNSLFPFMDMVAAEVKSGKLSADKGQYLIAEKINELDAGQRASILRNNVNSSNKSIMTNCHVVGNTVNCHSF